MAPKKKPEYQSTKRIDRSPKGAMLGKKKGEPFDGTGTWRSPLNEHGYKGSGPKSEKDVSRGSPKSAGGGRRLCRKLTGKHRALLAGRKNPMMLHKGKKARQQGSDINKKREEGGGRGVA